MESKMLSASFRLLPEYLVGRGEGGGGEITNREHTISTTRTTFNTVRATEIERKESCYYRVKESNSVSKGEW